MTFIAFTSANLAFLMAGIFIGAWLFDIRLNVELPKLIKKK